MIKLRLQGTLAECVRKATTTCSGAAGDQVPGTPQDDVVLELEARSVTEALRLVVPQAPGMDWALRFGSWRVTVDGKPVGPGELDMRLADRAYVSVAPAVAGDGPAAAGIAPWVYWTIVGVTVASAVWAISQIPSIPDTDHLDETGERRRLFSGPVNSIAQGGAVPLIYGRTRVGSTVVSGGVSQERPTGGDHAAPDELGLGGDRPPGAERPGRDDRGRDAEAPRQPDPAGAASEERSVLRVVDLLGEGEIEGLAEPGLRSVFIDGIAVEDSNGDRTVDGVSVQIRRGLAHGAVGQEPLAGFDWTSTGLTHDRTKVEHGSPAAARIPGDDYDAARVTLRFPALFRQDESGDEVAAEVQVRIESRPVGGAWASVLLQTIRDLSTGPQEVSWRVERPDGVDEDDPWEIRVSRVTPDSDSLRVSDEVWWERLSGLRDVKQTYPHTAVAGLVIETDRSELNPTRREYEVKGRRVLAPPASIWNPNATATSAATYGAGLWDGTMRRVWTDNPAWILYDLLTDRRAGLGGVPGMVDAVRAARAEFLELSRRCDALVPAPNSDADTEPRWRFNGVIKRREQARKMIDWATSACRAGVSWAEGAAALAIDGESDVAAAVGNANVVDGEFEYSGLRWQERYSAAAVTWQDPDDDYRSGVELVVSDELVARHGFRQQDIAAVGCTSRGQAHRLGLLALSEQETESENVRFRMALEGMHLRPGDRIRIADERRFEARAAWRVVEVDTSGAGQETVTLDGPAPRLVAGGTIVWGESGSAAVTGTVAEPTKIVTTDVPTGLSAGDLVLNEAGAIDWVVSEVRERDQVEVEVEARRHHPGKYSAVEQRRELAPPLVDPIAAVLAPTAVTAVERTYTDRKVVRSLLEIAVEGGDDPRISQVEYQIQRPLRPATAAEITAGDWTVLPRGPWEPLRITAARSIVERDVARGGYRCRARFLSRRRRSGWTESAAIVVDGQRIEPVTGLALTKHGYRFGTEVVRGLLASYDADDSDFQVRLRWRVTSSPFGATPDLSSWTVGDWGNRLIYPGVVGATYEVEAQRGDPATSETQEDPEWSGPVTIELSGDLDPPDDPTNLVVTGIQGGYEGMCDDPRALPDNATAAQIAAARAADVDAWSWFHVEEDADGNFRDNPPAGSYVQRTTSPQCVFTGFDSAKRVKVWVRAIDVEVNGDNASNWLSAIAETKRPGTSIGKPCTSCVLTSSAVNGVLSSTLTWTLPDDDVPEQWKIQYGFRALSDSSGEISWGTAFVVPGTDTSHTNSGTAPANWVSLIGTRAYARIQSVSGGNQGGAEHAEAEISGTAALEVPVVTATPGDGYVDLFWTSLDSASTYGVERGTSSLGPWTSIQSARTTTSYRDSGLTNETTHWYRVRGQTSNTDGSWSTPVSATPTAGDVAPSAPINVGLTADGQTEVDGDWDAPVSWGTGSTSSRTYRYRLLRGTAVVSQGTTTASSRTFTGLAAGTVYTLEVRAETDDGNSVYVSDTATTAASLAWGSWSSFTGTTANDYPYGTGDISDAANEVSGALKPWNKGPALPMAPAMTGIWAGASRFGTFGVHGVDIGGSIVNVQVFQSVGTIANRMRRVDTDTHFQTNTAYLNLSGTSLDNYRTSSFDFLACLLLSGITDEPSSSELPGTRRAIAFLRWTRESAGSESGEQTLYILHGPSSQYTNGAYYHASRRYE